MTDQQTLLDDSWTTTSGLPLADADVEITDFSFGYNPKIGDGLTLVANITFRNLASGETTEQSFSTGKGWEAINKGAAAEKNGGTGKQSFNNQTNFGRLIDSAVNCGAGPQLAPRGQTYQAATWIGTQWHTTTEVIETTNPTTGESNTKDVVVFGRFLGVGDGGQPAAAASNGNGRAAAASAIDPDIEAQLIALAKQHSGNHDAFMEAAFDVPGVQDSKQLTNLVVDADKGIFATANAS
jgi:hypothetical protein